MPKPKTFLAKLEAARLKLGGVDKLYATLFREGIKIGRATICRWLKGTSKPHPNNVTVIEVELDQILEGK